MKNRYASSLMDFLDNSPCDFLAVNTIKKELDNNGFHELKSCDAWDIKPGQKYYVTKNDSAIFAFILGEEAMWKHGFKIIAAHSDSPCFRIKPQSEINTEGGIIKLNTEVYGGPILYTWFDRPLSVAGRVMLRGDDVLSPKTQLIKINRPILVIPHLAIHFNRSVNEGNPLSKQKDMLPILGIIKDEISRENILLKLIAKELDVDIKDIIDFDLLIYDTTKSTRVGLDEEFISAGRIDDLSMVHAGLTALLDSNDSKTTRVLAIFDNEETGSGTKQGAASPVLKNILKRLIIATGGNDEYFYRAIAQSFMLSADNAHAFHPNYPEKYDITNHPVMGGGPVIKINANCKYMTDAHSSAIFKEICRKANVPMQYFVNHSDVAGGSTLGNILTSQIDIAGVDIGNPIWAMHSVRETGSVDDHYYMICALKQFFSK
ncbi:MAG: M18 family aminopeptidase [Muribaculaceae bacterium]